MHPIAPNLWELRHPLRLLGVSLGRRTTIIRLASGRLVIHSTAPFTATEVAAIRALGEPGWLVEATGFHDTFTRVGRAAFPGLPCLVPGNWSAITGLPGGTPLLPSPPDWAGELEVCRLAGMPRVDEHVLLHRPSRTLIVADLVFHLGPDTDAWTRVFMRALAGLRAGPGMSRLFRLMIRDQAAFRRSLAAVGDQDFDRLIPAHGEIVPRDGRALLAAVLARHGLAPGPGEDR